MQLETVALSETRAKQRQNESANAVGWVLAAAFPAPHIREHSTARGRGSEVTERGPQHETERERTCPACDVSSFTPMLMAYGVSDALGTHDTAA